VYEVKEVVCTYCLVGIHPRELSKVSEISLAVRATAVNQPKASDPEYGKFPSEKSSSRLVILIASYLVWDVVQRWALCTVILRLRCMGKRARGSIKSCLPNQEKERKALSISENACKGSKKKRGSVYRISAA
jgi:hypothetical protein